MWPPSPRKVRPYLFLKYDVQFESERSDGQLTDTHLGSITQCAMKLRLAA